MTGAVRLITGRSARLWKEVGSKIYNIDQQIRKKAVERQKEVFGGRVWWGFTYLLLCTEERGELPYNM